MSGKTPSHTTTPKAKNAGRKAAPVSKAKLVIVRKTANPAATAKAVVAPRRTPAAASHPVPAVVRRGRLTAQQVRHAVDVALRGQTFEADA